MQMDCCLIELLWLTGPVTLPHVAQDCHADIHSYNDQKERCRVAQLCTLYLLDRPLECIYQNDRYVVSVDETSGV